jgi:16S rRNA (cytosine967-C5)-methyltransferase
VNSDIKESFQWLWQEIVYGKRHFDSLLSELSGPSKSFFAEVMPVVLRRPVSALRELGIPVKKGEPWNLKARDLEHWKPIYRAMELLLDSEKLPSGDAIEEDYPPSLIEAWRRDWGAETCARLVKSLAQNPSLTLRLTRHAQREKIESFFSEVKSVRIQRGTLSPRALKLSRYTPVFQNPFFENGEYEVQDEGSQVMSFYSVFPDQFAGLLSATPGERQTANGPLELPRAPESIERVVDSCAGAGGKTLALADALWGKKQIFAYDVFQTKVTAMRKRFTRAHETNIKPLLIEEGNERQQLKKFEGLAQLVLVDAPCGGWGVLRRNPDVKWRDRSGLSEGLEGLPSLQLRLLSEYARLVAPGGRLVFGLCTFRKEESIDVTRKFTEAHPGFTYEREGFIGPDLTDGFYVASWIRK